MVTMKFRCSGIFLLTSHYLDPNFLDRVLKLVIIVWWSYAENLP